MIRHGQDLEDYRQKLAEAVSLAASECFEIIETHFKRVHTADESVSDEGARLRWLYMARVVNAMWSVVYKPTITEVLRP